MHLFFFAPFFQLPSVVICGFGSVSVNEVNKMLELEDKKEKD
jgi:hypothetical protein